MCSEVSIEIFLSHFILFCTMEYNKMCKSFLLVTSQLYVLDTLLDEKPFVPVLIRI